MYQTAQDFRAGMVSALAILLVSLLGGTLQAQQGNRLTYMDSFLDPYYVSGEFPKLTTPQWVGEEGVEAVVVLAIDDMRDTARYENYLRPILERLKEIDGRAPVSIMTNRVNPEDPRLAGWLKEGLNIDVHTIDHPCPCLQKSDLPQSKRTYHQCVDLMASIPGNRPVAFRMPCCDSLNTPSPRFWTEIFNDSTSRGNFLSIDSSVFNVITPADHSLPRTWVTRPDGEDRFGHYIPFPSFVNTIKDYPYPYLIGRACWEFPCIVPSDWAAQHVQQPNNPETVRDMKIALDVVVRKQGVYNLVFHPHGWIRNDQVIELIDHAVSRYGPKVKFLNFREAADRLQKHLLLDQPLRAADGSENGVRLLDLDHDGYLDVVIANDTVRQTRRWSPAKRQWRTTNFPVDVRGPGTRFGLQDQQVIALHLGDRVRKGWRWNENRWAEDPSLVAGLEEVFTEQGSIDQGLRLRDADGNGACEVIVANETTQAVFRWSGDRWDQARLAWPKETWITDRQGRDAGLRFLDIDQDGLDDLLFSRQDRYSLHLWDNAKRGWSIEALSALRATSDEVPMIVRNGTNNGAWFHSDHLWVQNEDTAVLSNLVDRRSFTQLLKPLHGDMPPPKSPQQSLRTIRVPSQFKVELVATEPLVADPVAFDWGIDGSLWVVEMGDYPLGADGKGAPGGRVKHLLDTDGDGRYDKADLFLDKIPFPNGIKVWKKGILVTAAPNVFYAEDTDGDGKADHQQVLFAGFREGNQQHRVNGLRWGLENWLYLANGDSGGSIRSMKTNQVLSIAGRDLRIRPGTGAMEAIAGQTQFGRNRDDWGNWFGGNNSNPMWHYVLEDYVLRRNPHVTAPSLRHQVSDQPGASPVFPTSRTLTRFNDLARANRFTSACSPIVYRDSYLEELVNNAFICEPVHNLVHREIMADDGTSFTSRRAPNESQSEFLTSSDNWFRPTTIRTGPDGALWIADMYRLVIEHPEWIPRDWQERLDLRSGSDRGRIYRITRFDDKRFPASTHPLEGLPAEKLVAELNSSNGWRRDMAQELLVRNNDPRTIKPLQEIARSSDSPLARLHALCTLDGMGQLGAEIVQPAMTDPHAGVRRHAVRLARGVLTAEIQDAVIRLSETEKDPQVKLQIAILLGFIDSVPAGEALGRFAARHLGETYLYAASLSSIHEKNLAAVMQGALSGTDPPPGKLLEQLLAISAGLGNQEIVSSLIVDWTSTPPYAPWQIRAVTSTLASLKRKKPKQKDLLSADALAGIRRMIQRLPEIVKNSSLPVKDRREMVSLLAYGEPDDAAIAAVLESLLTAQQPPGLQAAAVSAILQFHKDGASRLLRRWPSASPAMRSQMITEILLVPRQASQLLDALEQGMVPAGHLAARQRQQLSQHPDQAIARRATTILKLSPQTDRAMVLQTHQAIFQLEGDTARGRLLYSKHCANCHRLEGVGFVVGPDLAALTDRSPQTLLTAMLDPNRAVEAKFLEFTALTTDGRQSAGILTRETTTDLTLSAPGGKQFVILRKDIELLRSSGKSLMPIGLEKDMSHQDFADLIGYIRGQGPPPKSFLGNKPSVVHPNETDQVLELMAKNCRIYGPALRFEETYGNLGFWRGEQDRAEWTFELPRARKYEVWMDFACDQGTAGNKFQLRSSAGSLKGTVPSTGTWDTYQQKIIGTISLPAGTSDLTFQSDGEPGGFLMDLRAIRLKPAP